MKHQRVGLHVSAAGGAENAPERAKELVLSVFSFFRAAPEAAERRKLLMSKLSCFAV